MQVGVAPVIEASSLQNNAPQRIIQLNDRDHHNEDSRRDHDRRQREERERHERQERERHRHRDDNKDIGAIIIGAFIIGSIFK